MKINIAKTNIEISFWFFGVTTLLLTLIPESDALYCFIFCAIHELGHLFAMLLIGKKNEGIRFDYFGIKIITEKRFFSPLKEAAIAAGGPVMNLFVASFLFLAGKRDFAEINLALAFFNLLPVSILDGGHILSDLFPGSKTVKALSIVSCVLLLITGIIIAAYSKKNFTLLIVSLYLLTGIAGKKD